MRSHLRDTSKTKVILPTHNEKINKHLTKKRIYSPFVLLLQPTMYHTARQGICLSRLPVVLNCLTRNSNPIRFFTHIILLRKRHVIFQPLYTTPTTFYLETDSCPAYLTKILRYEYSMCLQVINTQFLAVRYIYYKRNAF